MCELFAMSSRLPATVSFSLEELARHGCETGPQRDGWGVAYYDDGDVRLIREPEPAGDSEYVRFIEQHDLRSTIVLSHIRKATQGARHLKNTQPFGRELGGRMHIFAHNGDLRDVRSQPALELGGFRPIGDTDSEHAFCALLHRLEPLWSALPGCPPLADRLRVFREFMGPLRELGPANVIYSDGDALFLHGHLRRPSPTAAPRAPGLHVLSRHCPSSVDRTPIGGVRIRTGSVEQEVVLAASVPLTGESWRPLEEGEILVLAGGQILDRAGPSHSC